MTLGAVFLREEDEFIPELLRKSFLYGAFIAACIYWFWRSRLNGLHSGRSRNSKLDAH
jgi:hypothetical protein